MEEIVKGFAFLRRDGFALATALISMLIVGVVLTGGFYSSYRASLEESATQSAGILAQEALRAFAREANASELSRLDIGADTVVTRVSIITGQTQSGAFTVLVSHIEPNVFSIKSTGRLETPKGPVICTVDLRWRPARLDDALRVSPAFQPVCNGTPVESMILVRTHEVSS
jgi:type II secretory pathway pseudopilin PulG